MTCRERVLKALKHEATDITPYNLDLTADVNKRLCEHFGDEHFWDKTGSHLAQGDDSQFTWVSDTEFYDKFGVLWSNEQEGDFGVIVNKVLKDASMGDYRLPEPDLEWIGGECGRIAEQKDKFRIYRLGFSLYERAWTLRGIEDLLMDFVTEPAFVHELFDHITDYNLKVVDEVAKYDVDCVLFGDDWGQQRGLIMGPAIWREFIKPQLKKMYSRVKAKGMFVGQHSCGDVREVFPDLAEMGLDIYNTFQPEIYDVAEMKRLYGDTMTFYGGVSTQVVLPFGSPQEVKRQTRELIEVVGKGGGYICAPTHAIPNDVPTENILAFLEVVQNQNG